MSLSSSTKKQRAQAAVKAMQATPSFSKLKIQRSTPKTNFSPLSSSNLSLHTLLLPPNPTSGISPIAPQSSGKKTNITYSQSSKTSNLLPNYSFIKQSLEYDQILENVDYTFIRNSFPNDEVDKVFLYLKKNPQFVTKIFSLKLILK